MGSPPTKLTLARAFQWLRRHFLQLPAGRKVSRLGGRVLQSHAAKSNPGGIKSKSIVHPPRLDARLDKETMGQSVWQGTVSRFQKSRSGQQTRKGAEACGRMADLTAGFGDFAMSDFNRGAAGYDERAPAGCDESVDRSGVLTQTSLATTGPTVRTSPRSLSARQRSSALRPPTRSGRRITDIVIIAEWPPVCSSERRKRRHRFALTPQRRWRLTGRAPGRPRYGSRLSYPQGFLTIREAEDSIAWLGMEFANWQWVGRRTAFGGLGKD